MDPTMPVLVLVVVLVIKALRQAQAPRRAEMLDRFLTFVAAVQTPYLLLLLPPSFLGGAG